MRQVAVLGAAGFVASALMAVAEPTAAEVTLIDPVAVGRPILEQARRRYKSVDVRQTRSLRESGDLGNVDVVVVLAGQTDVDQALENPEAAFTANQTIAVEVGEWWRRNRQARVVYLSSDEVLGVSDLPLTEDAPYRPTQPYAASKAAAEMTLRCYSETYGLDLVVVRSCNLVGGRQRARKLIPTAVQYLSSMQPVPIFGSGHQVREYLAVSDLCDALQMAMDFSLPPGIYNCSSASSYSVLEVVDIIAAALEVDPWCIHVKDRLVHDHAYAMDASLLHSFGWKAITVPAEAIAKAAIELCAAWWRGEDLTTPGARRN